MSNQQMTTGPEIQPSVDNPNDFFLYFKKRGISDTHISGMFLAEKVSGYKKALAKDQLELQKILLDLKNQINKDKEEKAKDANYQKVASISFIEEKLSDYRTKHAALKNRRLEITNYVDKVIVQELMKFERPYEYDEKSKTRNQDYVNISKYLFTLREEEEIKQQQANEKIKEMALYKAHINNEIKSIEAEYIASFMKEANEMFRSYLSGLVEEPDIEAVKSSIMGLTLRPANKFQRKLVSDKEAYDIGTSIKRNSLQELQKTALEYLDQRFSLYKVALAHAKEDKEKTLKSEEVAANQEIQAVKSEAEEDIGINNLKAQSVEAPIFVEGKKIKRTMVVSADNYADWSGVVNILAIILKIPNASRLTTVKDYGNLKVSQIAEMITKYSNSEEGELFSELLYTEKKK